MGQLEIAPGEGCRHPSGDFYDVDGATISGLDWITLAALRDTENALLDYDSVDSPVAGITMWQTLTEWFEKAGYELVFSNVGITQVGTDGINKLNGYYMKGYTVVSLIDDSLLAESTSVHSTIPKHWTVWNGPVTEESDASVQLRLFSWGEINMLIKPASSLSFFKKRFFGALVFKAIR